MAGDILEKEIREQPDVLKNLIASESDHVAHVAHETRGAFDYVIIAARGTSDNAARYAQYLLGAHNQIPVALATPSLFTLYRKPPLMKSALVMGISQSGQSPDIVSVVEEGRRQGQPTVAITNDPQSPLGSVADHVIQLHTGRERSVAATKTYTASLCALALLSAHLNSDDDALAQLNGLPERMEEVIEETSVHLPRVERYRFIEHLSVIGRGFNYATAFEISLKITELTQTVAEPYSSADFLHGPIAMVTEGFPVIVISPRGSVLEDMRAFVKRLGKLNPELIMISDEPDLLNQANLGFPLPTDLPEWLTPMISVVPGQLFSLALARDRGLDPDKPEGLTKDVILSADRREESL
ncbi:MAG: glucosamine--fructose-6-phosphate aminotransferase [Anaerolineae bacterium SM23_ 63]|nr:MAG: glucosamine--fructose-6-phosphate aminotransferase [Anaerolineae bacterium SM23_ 63]